MPITYLIDGYNLIHSLGLVRKQIAPTELETARRRLIDFLHDRLETLADEISVIFDAKRQPRHLAAESLQGRIHIRFAARNEEADDVIESLLAEHPAPNRVVVVSDDHRLRRSAERCGARGWGCQELLDFLDLKPAPARPLAAPKDAKEGGLSSTEVEAWLKEFGDVELPNEYRDFLEPPALDE